ncbi:MAG: protein-glutamate O-methyltransferase CheR [Gammaproteobacteria bacterium]|nr:protein-glutamate O-methyltransferase CheR [Gammaproteobacteria bacterium]
MFNFFRKKNSHEDTSNSKSQPIVENFNNTESIASYFKIETGITFEKQQSILKSKLISFCRIHHIISFQACLEQVKINNNLKQELINYLTTNESYFYREYLQIDDLVKQVKKKNSVVDILCAPSSTGEEAYSIAIALLSAGIPKNQFNLTGIDINTKALEHAQTGIYNERNISKLPKPILLKYFKKIDSKYYLSDEIKQCVHLKTENIFNQSFKIIGRFDYIFSRNMLIYFDMETKIKAKKILEDLLKNKQTPIYFGHADLF